MITKDGHLIRDCCAGVHAGGTDHSPDCYMKAIVYEASVRASLDAETLDTLRRIIREEIKAALRKE